MTTGQAMDMPDGAGWWAYDEGLHKEVRHLLEWTDTGERLLYRWSSREFNNECTKESFRLSWPGVWYKLPPMPWEPQPPTTVQAMDDNGLLPCPFCGGEGHCEKKGNSVAHYVVLCNGCRTKMIGTQQDDAIAAWNRRTTTVQAITLSPQSVKVIREVLLQTLYY